MVMMRYNSRCDVCGSPEYECVSYSWDTGPDGSRVFKCQSCSDSSALRACVYLGVTLFAAFIGVVAVMIWRGG